MTIQVFRYLFVEIWFLGTDKHLRLMIVALVERPFDWGFFIRYRAINTRPMTPKINKKSVSRNCNIFDSAVWLILLHNNFKKSQDGRDF